MSGEDIRTLRRSFGGGVLTPEFFGRVDDVKFQTGLGICKNFIVLPHGPVANRGGTKFVRATKYADKYTRLLPFTFSNTQTYVIELGDQYMRFHTMGATLGPSTSAYNGGTAYVVGDCVTSSGVSYYCIQDGTGHTPASSPTYWYPMPDGILEIPTPYVEADLNDMHYVQSNDVFTLTHPNYEPAELRRFIPSANTAYSFALVDIAFASDLAAPVISSVVATVGSGSTTYKYKVTAVGSDGVEESLPSAEGSVTNNLLTTGNKNTITWGAVTGASRYNVYLQDNGLFGFIGQTNQLSFVDENIAADISKTPPIQDLPFTGASNYPAEASYYEQRRFFGGTDNKPQNFWMTRSATESNLSYSIPLRDDDAVRFRIAAREANPIRHAVPLADLLILTASTEWRVTSVNTDAITPTSVSIKPQSYVGASNVRPIIANNNVIFEADRGGHWYEMGYQQNVGYVTNDLSLRAPHLFDFFSTMDMAYAKAPYPIVWGVSSNGSLTGLTYVPGQNVGAFHQHFTETLGGKSTFKSVAVVAEGQNDPWYAVVEREIDGSTVQYIERYEERYFPTRENAYFVDCGVTYDVPLTITGITNADPAVVTTATAHGLSNGNVVDLRDIISSRATGSEVSLADTLNRQKRYKVANVTTYTFELQTDDDTPEDVDTTDMTTYKRGGTVRKTITGLSSGLDHLEGEVVSVLANGAVEAQKTVTGGAITFDNPASIVHVGLPITADIETLPLYVEGDRAFGQGMVKNINKVWLRVYRSEGIFVGPDFDNLVENEPRTTEDYGQPPSLKSEELEAINLTNSWDGEGTFVVRQLDPLPLTIASMTLEVVLGN